jgi:GT2 family glycosyltransferase
LIGVGILTYNRFEDFIRCFRSVKFHTKGMDIEIMVFDNSDKTDLVKQYCTKGHPEVVYLNVGENVGCTRSRNIMYKTFRERHPESEWLVIMDHDVEVHDNWLPTMLRTAKRYPKAGIVAWPIANMRPFYVDLTNGCISAAASLCHLHRMRALREVDRMWPGPWDERFFFFRFDSLICDRLNLLGWRTHIILDMYEPDVPWMAQPSLITHHHPHLGVKSNPKYWHIVKESTALYRQIKEIEGWESFDPKTEPYEDRLGGRRARSLYKA